MEAVTRPWGNYTVLYENDNYKIKKIIVNPKSRLSLQSHKHRSEHWTIVKGYAIIQLGKDKLNLTANQHAFIPKETIHRIENNSESIVELIEVQIGDYLGEDDIVRYEDDYSRNWLINENKKLIKIKCEEFDKYDRLLESLYTDTILAKKVT